MKRKELQNLAKKIAKEEKKIQMAQTPEEKRLAEEEIMFLSGRVTNINDMVLLDDMIQELLND